MKTCLYHFDRVFTFSSKCRAQGLTAEDFVYAVDIADGEGSKHLQELQEIISDK